MSAGQLCMPSETPRQRCASDTRRKRKQRQCDSESPCRAFYGKSRRIHERRGRKARESIGRIPRR